MQPEPSAVILPWWIDGSQEETPTLTEETVKRTSSEEESGSDYSCESDSNSHSGSDSRSESSSSALPSQNNLSKSRKDLCFQKDLSKGATLICLWRKSRLQRKRLSLILLWVMQSLRKKSRLKMIRRELLQKSPLTNLQKKRKQHHKMNLL